MFLNISATPTDIVQLLILLLSQWPLCWFLARDLRPRVSRQAWGTVAVLLVIMWIVCGIAFLLQIFAFRTLSVPVVLVRTVTIALELTWSTFSVWGITVYALYRLFARRRDVPFSSARRTALRVTATVAAGAPVAAIGFGGIIKRTRFHVKETDLPVPGLHPDLAGLRIVQLSDLHVSPFLSVRDCARVVDMANELRADLAVVTGDIISSIGDPLEASIRELARLRATAGILGCHGNHEIYARCQNRATRLGRENGIEFLRGQSRQLRFGSGVLNVTGVDFQRSNTKPDYLSGMESEVVTGATNLLLSHSPDVFPVAVRKGFHTMLAGHTHGGQVTVEILNQTLNTARVFTPFVAGLYRIDVRSCYVTAGIGTIGVPVRLGAPPEISLLRLRPA